MTSFFVLRPSATFRDLLRIFATLVRDFGRDCAKVKSRIGLPVAYKLKMNHGWCVHPVFHVSLLELYREDGRVQPPPPPVEMEGALEYEVESILEHRFWGIKHPKAFFKVAWKGYGIEHNSWEPESNVVNAPEVVADYWKRQAEKQAGLGALLHA
jgi:hypothetical protein